MIITILSSIGLLCKSHECNVYVFNTLLNVNIDNLLSEIRIGVFIKVFHKYCFNKHHQLIEFLTQIIINKFLVYQIVLDTVCCAVLANWEGMFFHFY